jgi:hypothetical protein
MERVRSDVLKRSLTNIKGVSDDQAGDLKKTVFKQGDFSLSFSRSFSLSFSRAGV